LAAGLLSYSEKQVPEGKAIFDLSFGPKPTGFKALIWAFLNARNTLFRGRFGIGKPPLQTRLTTTLTPFSHIRRESDRFYDEPFPDNEEINRKLISLHDQAMASTKGRIQSI
jgi:kynurenine 3-monooxygenase